MVHFLAMTGARFAALREQTGWTRRHLARLLGCNESLVRRWETGGAPVPSRVGDWLVKVAHAIGQWPAPPDWKH